MPGDDTSTLIQETLLPTDPVNPLRAKFGPEFFREIPSSPGVYFMSNDRGAILYVGKAKNLRNRLKSYRLKTAVLASRKTYRLLRMVKSIRWELCASEGAALLLENRYLRDWKPPFNSVNLMPELHPFITLKFDRRDPTLVRFRLTTQPETRGERVFGAYKGRGVCRRGYAALLRLLWAVERASAGLSQEMDALTFFPPILMRDRPPARWEVPYRNGASGWLPHVMKFLSGDSDQLLAELTLHLLENAPGLHPFHYVTIEEDLAALAEFYEIGPARTRTVRHGNRIRKRVVAQTDLDDLLALRSIRR